MDDVTGEATDSELDDLDVPDAEGDAVAGGKKPKVDDDQAATRKLSTR